MKSLPRNRNGIDVESDVYKMLQDYEKPISEPKQSGSFRYLQGMLEASENGKEVCTQAPFYEETTGMVGFKSVFHIFLLTKFCGWLEHHVDL